MQRDPVREAEIEEQLRVRPWGEMAVVADADDCEDDDDDDVPDTIPLPPRWIEERYAIEEAVPSSRH
jgi:hypothetical protein